MVSILGVVCGRMGCSGRSSIYPVPGTNPSCADPTPSSRTPGIPTPEGVVSYEDYSSEWRKKRHAQLKEMEDNRKHGTYQGAGSSTTASKLPGNDSSGEAKYESACNAPCFGASHAHVGLARGPRASRHPQGTLLANTHSERY